MHDPPIKDLETLLQRCGIRSDDAFDTAIYLARRSRAAGLNKDQPFHHYEGTLIGESISKKCIEVLVSRRIAKTSESKEGLHVLTIKGRFVLAQWYLRR